MSHRAVALGLGGGEEGGGCLSALQTTYRIEVGSPVLLKHVVLL